MKLLIVMNYRPNRGGITGQIDELIRSLKDEGWDVSIASTHGGLGRRLKGIAKAVIHAFRCERILGVGSAYRGFFPIMVASAAAFIAFRKVVFNFHDGQVQAFLNDHSRLARIVIGKRPVVCASGYVAQCFRNRGFLAVEIPNHFRIQEIAPPRRSDFLWNGKIMWVRSFMELYQPEMGLKAAVMALKQNGGLEFHFYGDGPLLAGLKKKYERPGIIFQGFVPRDKLLGRYKDYSMLINTTRCDNFPLSIVEAGINRICVLTTRIGGIATIYRDNEVVYFHDEKDLAEKILTIARFPKDFESFRDKLYQKTTGFTWSFVRDKWLRCLA